MRTPTPAVIVALSLSLFALPTPARRHRCACRRELLPVGDEPVIEILSTVDRIRHTREACERYRTMERRAPPEALT